MRSTATPEGCKNPALEAFSPLKGPAEEDPEPATVTTVAKTRGREVCDGEIGVGREVWLPEGVRLPPLCGHPPAGRGVCAGLWLAAWLDIATPTHRPLAKALLGAANETLASRKQLAAPKRSSVKAKA